MHATEDECIQSFGGVWSDMDWIHLAQDRDQWSGYGYEPSGSIKCLEILEWVSDCQLLKKA
jgi:hypothetical protein